ncbi:MAG: tetratricopeptide repeat protein [Mojavia pulchra JT2-VF2]|jgi:tetratricopeptide (TPR) repeat protein|uniref:Tetratricopeptide repeat protein n=1 Tax=Mojavia pulchra JT2-VF2 TaxID=287848 RepID=A0A951PUD0_9NOST|nr:tetratricopeptide repeat protein [Mojavia pulchra JT2-VF2]
MRSRTFTLFSLFTAALTGFLFCACQKQQIVNQGKPEQITNTNISKTPQKSIQNSEKCVVENTEQDTNTNLIKSEQITVEQADKLWQEGTNQYTKEFKYNNALKNFEIALKVYQKEKNFDKQAITLGSIGTVYYQIADYNKAINCHKQRQIIAGVIKNGKEEAAAYGSLGNAYYAMGNYPKARLYYNRILKRIVRNEKISMDKDDRKRAEAIALAGLGSVAHSVGNYTKAIKLHEERLNIVNEALNNQDLTEENRKYFIKLKASAFGGLGNAYHKQGNDEKAIEYYKIHLETAVDDKDKREEAIALGELGSAYHRIWQRSNFREADDLDKAIKHYEERLKIAESIGDRRLVASTYGGLGNIYYSTGNLEKANLEKSHNDYNEAIKYTNNYLNISTGIKDKPGMGNALSILGVTYFQINNILKNQEKTLKKAGRITEAEQKFAEAQENLDKAIKNLNEAIEVRESLRKGLTEIEKYLFLILNKLLTSISNKFM